MAETLIESEKHTMLERDKTLERDVEAGETEALVSFTRNMLARIQQARLRSLIMRETTACLVSTAAEIRAESRQRREQRSQRKRQAHCEQGVEKKDSLKRKAAVGSRDERVSFSHSLPSPPLKTSSPPGASLRLVRCPLSNRPLFRKRNWPYQVTLLSFVAERHVFITSGRTPVCVYLQFPSGSLSRCIDLI